MKRKHNRALRTKKAIEQQGTAQGCFQLRQFVVTIFLWILCPTFSLAASVAQVNVPARISSDHFPSLYGLEDNSLVVYTFRGGSLVEIPVQWTQLTDEGTVYSPVYAIIEMSGDVARIDKYDRLEFMYLDAGQKPCLQSSQSLLNLVQIRVQPHKNEAPEVQRYICIAQRSALTKFIDSSKMLKDYVAYDSDLGQAASDAYYLSLDQDNPLIWNDFHYQGVNLDQGSGLPIGDSILDSLKINIEAGVFSEMAKIHLDNSNLHTEILDVQHGPIYDSMFGVTKVKLAGATVLNMQIMMHFYPHHVEMKTRFKIPSVAKAIVKVPRVNVSLDANNMWGSKVITSWGPDAPLLVNGQLDEVEKAFTEQKVNSKDSWIWYSTQRGFDLFTFIDFDDEFEVPIALVYDDDRRKEIKPERFVGQGPNVGYSIRGMVMGKYFTFNTNLLFSAQVPAKDVESNISALKRPWSFTAIAVNAHTTDMQTSLTQRQGRFHHWQEGARP